MTKILLKKMKMFKIPEYPCECGLKRKIAKNRSEFVKYFNYFNRFTNTGMHNSVYSFSALKENGKPDYSSARVDKIPFDIDLQDYDYDTLRCYLAALSLHLFCEDLDLQHVIVKTKNGYHAYIGADGTGIANDDKDAFIRAAIDLVEHITGIVTCVSFSMQPVKHMIRSIGSFCTKRAKKRRYDADPADEEEVNLKKDAYEKWIAEHKLQKMYCTSLPHDVLHSGVLAIYKYATHHSFDVHYMGTNRIVLESLRPKPRRLKNQYLEEENNAFDALDEKGNSMTDIYQLLESFGIFIEDIAPCVKVLMKIKKMGYHNRFFLVVWLDSMNLSKKEIRMALKLILSKEKYHHAYEGEDDKPGYIVDCIHSGTDYGISCGSMRMLGFCVGDRCETRKVFI